MTVREPVLTTVAIGDLRPTQITVGMREVEAKRKRWRETSGKNGAKFLGSHMIPVVLGPKHRHYVVDHHHLSLALHKEGVKELAVTVTANLSALEADEFWTVMDNRNWMHPFDVDGRRRHYDDIPKAVTDLVDDPFRSLAGERRRVKRKVVENDFSRAIEKALELAKSDEATHLPGWCGPAPEA